MGLGYLKVNVFSDNIAQPLTGAKVEISADNKKQVYYTNQFGQTESIPLACPNKEYSLQPQSRVRPYAVYDIVVSINGLRTEYITGVQILDTTSSYIEVYLYSLNSGIGILNIPIGDNVLWGNYSPKIAENPDDMDLDLPPDVLPKTVVPEYVIVHDGLPSNNQAPNYTVNFADYIKNVASSEIYSTWPVECLKANIWCIISFTLNRVYLEWYPSKGQNFTITTSTAYDQCYIHGRNIFNEISTVVDQVFDEYIRIGTSTQPFFSQYNDGINVNNPGWLSQWGSKELAEAGYSAQNIIKYYYGNAKSITTAPVVEGMPVSFPGFTLEKGMCGDAIQQIQLELNVINGGYPGIPKIIPADGKYENDTVNTVKIFQGVFNLPVTGKIDYATWYRISNVFTGVSNNNKIKFVN